MRNTVQLGFGGFLIGLGLGWYISQTFEISYILFAWLVVIAGVAVIVSALISWKSPRLPVGWLPAALMIGLVLSLFLSSGFGFEERYRAEGTRTFDGIVNANSVSFLVANRNGEIRVSTWNESEYKVELTIRAKGFTYDEAQRLIDGLDIDLIEERVQNQLRLILDYNIPSQTWNRLSIQVTAKLPAAAKIALDLDSSNGGIYLSNITGETVQIQTSNGPLVVEKVYAENILGITSNGEITGETEATVASLATSNGRIQLVIPSTASGDYDLTTSNGAISLTLSASPQVGYDLDLSTSNGNIDIDLSDLDYTKNEKTNKNAKTTGFAGRAVQITIEADTSNGNVNIGT
jgi:hypothetical protein